MLKMDADDKEKGLAEPNHVFRFSFQIAHYYDLEYRDYADDLDFYRQFAQWNDVGRERPVLELGCGTGRVTLALAEAGFDVTALDSSAGMLEVCRLYAEERGLGGKITFVQGDMQEPGDLPVAHFGLAICALNTFAYLPTTTDQLRMLRAVHSLLAPGGRLLLDLTPPVPGLLTPDNGEMLHQGSFSDDESGGVLHKFVTGAVRHATQTHSVTIFYDYEQPDGTLTRLSQPLSFRWTGRYEMALLLAAACYTLDNVYGDYELGEYGEGSERMIFAAGLA